MHDVLNTYIASQTADMKVGEKRQIKLLYNPKPIWLDEGILKEVTCTGIPDFGEVLVRAGYIASLKPRELPMPLNGLDWDDHLISVQISRRPQNWPGTPYSDRDAASLS